MASYYVELNGGDIAPKTTLQGGNLTAKVAFSGAQIYPTSGGGGANLTTKSVSYTPTESAISDSLTPPSGYDGFSQVDVSVGAISSTYVGTGITRRTSSDLSASGATVTAPSGYYENSASKTVTDANLIASNIKKNVTIFGVTGTFEGDGMSDDVKDALLTLASKVAYIDDEGQDAYMDLLNALYPVQSISAVYTQSGTVYDTDSLDSLKADLVVTGTLEDSSTVTLPASLYTLSGSLTVGTSTITVTFSELTTTFTVTVTLDRVAKFGAFTDGHAVVKTTSGTPKKVFRQVDTARACAAAPVANNGYTFTVTDSTKYNLVAYDVTSLTKQTSSVPSSAEDGYYYTGGSKSISWKTSDSASTDYVWLALKKLDGTSFTDAELANAAEAVFTFTES